ncbi:MSCRAMM family protein [Petropleomorpha daqingensis]|uniref:SpaA-like prealbumin fold domain-containing protein n=1 Tax=Petropleomorpha daqingensis TaxID=2026353 RepID=A0A853CK84_9ACTN|nr:prealbumin-like fold domain-containing protein [Petropleomorpha daqingensis]NYJ06932.1 hypothetical protein [Petropleomorpha daqingensis]
MPAPARRTGRRLLTRRGVAQGSVLGLGLLLATTATAPAASAAPGNANGNANGNQNANGPTSSGPVNTPPGAGNGNGVGNGTGGANGTGQGATNGTGVGDGTGNGVGNGNGVGSGNGNATSTPPDGGTPPPVVDPPPIGPVFGPFPKDMDPTNDIAVEPTGDVPGDLDLSGAQFTLTSTDDPTVSETCVTDESGRCTVHASVGQDPVAGQLYLPGGSYTVHQTTAVAGLAPAEADATLDVCTFLQAFLGGCPGGVTVQNAAQFRTAVVAEILDADSGQPVPGAEYQLTGQDYPHLPGPDGQPVAAADAVETSGDDGLVSFAGFFLPGTWTLTPGTTPDGYDADEEFTVEVTPPGAQDDGGPVTVQRLLHAAVVPGETTTPPAGDDGTTPPADGDGTTTPGDTGSTDTPPTSDPTGTTGNTNGTTGPTGTTGTSGSASVAPGGAPGGRVAAADQGTASAPTDDPAPAAPPAAPSSAGASTPSPAAEALAAPPAADTPALQTESSSIPEVGLIGFGLLLVVAIVVAVNVLRRRARGRA